MDPNSAITGNGIMDTQKYHITTHTFSLVCIDKEEMTSPFWIVTAYESEQEALLFIKWWVLKYALRKWVKTNEDKIKCYFYSMT